MKLWARGMKPSALGCALLPVILVLLNCSGTPLSPTVSGWLEILTLTSHSFGINNISVYEQGIVFLAGSYRDTGVAVIWKYENGKLTDDFISPYDDTILTGIGFADRIGWAVGSKKREEVWEPFLLFYDGSKWAEIIIEASIAGDYNAFSDVFAIGENAFWATTYSGYSGEDTSVVKYNNGEWTLYPNINGVEKGVYSRYTGYFYLLNARSQSDSEYLKLTITADGGATWFTETIDGIDGSFDIIGLPYTDNCLSAVPGALFFNAEVECNGERYDGAVVKRTGPPGGGKYELVFFSNKGPFFWDIRDLAFKDEFHGIATGRETSVIYDDPDWVLEDVTSERLTIELITAGPDGYWAIADSELGGDTLMYHP